MLRLVHCNGKSGRESLSRKLHLEKISLAIFILGYDFLPLENELVNCSLSLVLLTPTRSTCFKIVSSFPLDCFSIGLVLVRLVAPLGKQVVEPVGEVEDGEEEREDEPADHVDPLGAAGETGEDRL